MSMLNLRNSLFPVRQIIAVAALLVAAVVAGCGSEETETMGPTATPITIFTPAPTTTSLPTLAPVSSTAVLTTEAVAASPTDTSTDVVTTTVTETETTVAEAALLPAFTPIPTPVPGVIAVDTGVKRGQISSLVFGSNYGASTVPVRLETMPYAEASGITVLRYPGGAWGDQNNMQAFQIDAFVSLARKIGAEPYLHVRFTGGSPEQAASYVKYAKDKGYDIKYWSIGNEPSLYELAGLEWTAEKFAAEWRKFADAMRAVDPSILLVGPEIHQFNGTDAVDPKDSTGKDWLRTFLKANGDLVDVVSVHRYPFPNNAERSAAQPAELLADAAKWNDLVRNLKAIVREETGKDLPVAITEFNSHWTNSVSGETTPDSFLSALWLGDVMGRLVNEQVTMANQFLLTSGGENGFGLISRTEPRPGYYVYQLYKQLGDQLVASSSPEPAVSTVAAMREDGALTLMLTNTGAETVTLPIQIAGFTPTGDAEVWRFDAEHNAEQVENTSIVAGAEVALPPRSMTLVVAK